MKRVTDGGSTVFMSSLNYLFSNGDLIKRIKLKLDCYTVEMKNNNGNESDVDKTEDMLIKQKMLIKMIKNI